jgi:thymidylate synthase
MFLTLFLAIPNMALPPCHLLCQFYVSTQYTPHRLSCQLYQRSGKEKSNISLKLYLTQVTVFVADMGLGVPFNVASYALFTILLAHVTGLQADKLIITLGDAHVYMDHIDALKVQLARAPKAFPKILVHDLGASLEERQGWSVERALEELEMMEFDRVQVEGYSPHPKIVMQMSV